MSKNKMPILLIVDDEPALRLLLNQFFQKNFTIVTLEGGFACLKYLEEKDEPQVLIIDLNMPDMSGVEVIKKIRSNSKWDKLAILVLSSAESSKDRINCLNSGADDFVIKPFNPEELNARINAILRRIR
ncbi:MAG: response regulator transcription factor [Bacteroidetes bacterium]|nr:response regulator transcription factor [Bacteroidota bacterium]